MTGGNHSLYEPRRSAYLALTLTLVAGLFLAACSNGDTNTALEQGVTSSVTSSTSEGIQVAVGDGVTSETLSADGLTGDDPAGTSITLDATETPPDVTLGDRTIESTTGDTTVNSNAPTEAAPVTAPDPGETSTSIATESTIAPSGGSSSDVSLMGGGRFGLVDPQILSKTGEGLSGADLESYLADRYEAFWAVYDDARSVPGTDPITAHPALAELASGEQLESALAGIDQLRAEGQAMREQNSPAIGGIDADAEHRVKVEVIDEGLAEITACAVNDDVRIDVATGSVVSGSTVTVRSSSTMVRTDGTWKLIRSQATEIVDGVGGCWNEGESAFPY